MERLAFASSRFDQLSCGLAGPDRRPDRTPGALAIPQHPAFAAAAAAVMAGGAHARALRRGWRQTPDGAVVFEHPGPGGTVRLQFAAASPDAAWSEIGRFGALSLDALLAVGLAAARPADGPVDAEVVLRAKGYARFGVERREFRAQVDAELDRLQRLSLRPAGEAAARPLFERAGDGLRPGAWAQEVSRWILLPTAALRFDHRANRGADVLAKKLAVWLALESRDEPRKPRQVRMALAGVGELPARIGERGARSGRLADRFDEALLRLEEAGLERLRYRGDSAAAGDRTRGWIARWLRQSLLVEPPAPTTLAPAWRRAPVLV